MGACVGKNSHLKHGKHEPYLPVPVKHRNYNNNNTNHMIAKFRESQTDRTLPKIYRLSYLSRQDFDPRSFDFTDELCQHILGYLSLEDRLRLECVCIQWQRLIFNGVQELHYPLPRGLCPAVQGMADKQWLWVSRQVLRKCHELTKINLVPTADTDVLSVLAKHCHRLEEIEWRFDNLRPVRREVLSKLCDECADSLTKVRIKELCEREFNSESGLSILIVYSEYLSNVTHVSVALDSDKCLKYFQLFADIYSERIAELELQLKFSSEYCLVGDTFAYVSLFRRLRALHLTLESVSNGQTLDVELSAGAQLLATQCPLLTRVTIELRDNIRVTGDQPVLASLSSLTNLQALEVRIRTDGIELGTLDALKPMVKLHQLSLTYGALTDWHTRDIADSCAQLSRLTLKTGQRLSDETLYSVSRLPRLKDFRLYCQPYVTQDIGDAGVCHMVANCHRLQHMALECGVKCSEVTFLALIGWANKRKHLSHRFSFSWERPDECNTSRDPNARLPAHELWPDLLRLPQNLTVVCREYFVGKCGTGMATAIERYRRLFKWSAPVANGVVVGADQLDSRCINRESVRSVGHTNPQTPPVYYKFARYPDVVPQPL